MRLKGTRIDWEHVIQLFQLGRSPEEIATQYGSVLTIDSVYAAVTYYLLNKAEYQEYVRKGDEIAKRERERYWASLTPEQREHQESLRARLRDLKARFTDAHGRLDHAALKSHVAAELGQTSGANG